MYFHLFQDAAAFAADCVDCDPPKNNPSTASVAMQGTFTRNLNDDGQRSMTSKSTKRGTAVGSMTGSVSGAMSTKSGKKSKALTGIQEGTAATGTTSAKSDNVFVSTEAQETKFKMNIADLTCRIEVS